MILSPNSLCYAQVQRAMSDILVCTEPEIRDEAEAFVSKLGVRPQICSVRSFKHWQEKAKLLLVYLKAPEPSETLRNCLREVSDNRSLQVLVYTHTHPSDDHQAVELGKIIGEYRPTKTYICFDSSEVEQFVHERIGLGRKRKKRTSLETFAGLRQELDLTRVDVANALDVTTRTVQNWEKYGTSTDRQTRDLRELYDLASNYIGAHQIPAWMDSPNDAFHKRTPREMIREGKTRDLILEISTHANR
jgi:DNA-binding XRE family transcriptional regulator